LDHYRDEDTVIEMKFFQRTIVTPSSKQKAPAARKLGQRLRGEFT